MNAIWFDPCGHIHVKAVCISVRSVRYIFFTSNLCVLQLVHTCNANPRSSTWKFSDILVCVSVRHKPRRHPGDVNYIVHVESQITILVNTLWTKVFMSMYFLALWQTHPIFLRYGGHYRSVLFGLCVYRQIYPNRIL